MIKDGPTVVSDSGYIRDFQFKGGRLGVLVFSQKEVVFSKLKYNCNGKSSFFSSRFEIFMLIAIFATFGFYLHTVFLSIYHFINKIPYFSFTLVRKTFHPFKKSFSCAQVKPPKSLILPSCMSLFIFIFIKTFSLIFALSKKTPPPPPHKKT